jgi:NAD(P)-dependent dehydrogenase (short-subunit alcohol dehydrogenase family)
MASGAVRELLKGDVALVTGAAQGNGAAIARGLAAAGASIVATEVTDIAQCEATARQAEAAVGPVSILVNNAGIVRRVAIEHDAFLGSVRQQFEINALGSAQMVKALLSQLTRTKGRVVNVGSIASFSATTGGIGYGASKGAVMLMTKTMAAELAPLGIRVNGIAPGVIVTPMTEPTRANASTASKYTERIPLGRFGEADELVGPVLFLASSLSTYVTCVMLPVDGGYLAV